MEKKKPFTDRKGYNNMVTEGTIKPITLDKRIK